MLTTFCSDFRHVHEPGHLANDLMYPGELQHRRAAVPPARADRLETVDCFSTSRLTRQMR
jgi:hypothetical protein